MKPKITDGTPASMSINARAVFAGFSLTQKDRKNAQPSPTGKAITTAKRENRRRGRNHRHNGKRRFRRQRAPGLAVKQTARTGRKKRHALLYNIKQYEQNQQRGNGCSRRRDPMKDAVAKSLHVFSPFFLSIPPSSGSKKRRNTKEAHPPRLGTDRQQILFMGKLLCGCDDEAKLGDDAGSGLALDILHECLVLSGKLTGRNQDQRTLDDVVTADDVFFRSLYAVYL